MVGLKYARASVVLYAIQLSSCLYGQDVWYNPTAVEAQTVFYQGMFSSQTQAAKYTGQVGFIATTGEKVVNKHGICTIQNINIKPEIDEVVPALKKSLQWSDLTINPLSIVYGFGKRVCHFATQRANASYGTEVLPSEDQSSDETISQYSLNFSKINIAQHGDINNFKKRFERCQQEHCDNNVIAYGVSRGAATTFQSLATLSKEGADISKIKLCILEGCFDDVASIMRVRHPWLLSSDRAIRAVSIVASKIISYRLDGPAPIKEVSYFPKTIPVAFITSKADREVPAQCTRRVAEALRYEGHPAIHLLELEKSSHPRYMFDDKDDALDYQRFVHALYEKYNLPHIVEYAEQGRFLI